MKLNKTMTTVSETSMSDHDVRPLTMELEQQNPLVYICEWDDCNNITFTDSVLFLQHVASHAKRQCERNPKGTKTTLRTEVEEEDESEEEREELYCQWTGCGDCFIEEDALKVHVSYHGYHSKMMSFGQCYFEAMRMKYGSLPKCQQDSSSRNILPELPVNFKCDWSECLGEFQDPQSFYLHVETHAMEDVIIPAISKDQLKVTRFAKCLWESCSSAFSSRTALKSHLKTHTQEKDIACPSCGTMFCDKQKFEDHLLRQLTKNDLDALIPSTRRVYRKVIEGEAASSLKISPSKSLLTRLKCSHCDREFATKRLLEEHQKHYLGSFKCNLCSHTCSSEALLKKHTLYRHSDNRPYECQFCDMSFKSRYDLRKHLYVHDDQERFKCLICAFTSRTSDSLNQHMRTKHQDEPPPVFQCHIQGCLKKYSRGNNLSRHLSRNHKLKPPPGQSRFSYSPGDDGFFRVIFKQREEEAGGGAFVN